MFYLMSVGHTYSQVHTPFFIIIESGSNVKN